MNGWGDLGNFIKGVGKGRQSRHDKEIRDLQLKALKAQSALIDKQEQARGDIISMLAQGIPQEPVQMPVDDPYGQYDPETVNIPQPNKPTSLKELMQSSEGQSKFLQAGYKPEDIRKFQEPNIAEIMASMQTYGAFNGQQGKPGGLRFKSFEIGADGKPKLGFDTSRLDEDKPLGVAAAKDMTDSGGRSPPPTMSMREAVAKGYATREERIQTSESARLALINQGADNISQIIGTIAPNGRINKNIVFQMDAPGGGIGTGRELNQLAYTAISGQLLLLTGVAARPEEVINMARAYIPTTLDLSNEGLAKKKLQRFKDLMEGNLDMATLPASVRERVEARRKAERKPSAPAVPSDNVIDFSQLKKK